MHALALLALGLAVFRLVEALLQALDVFADYHAYYRAAANLRAGADLYAEGKLLVARDSYDFWTQTDGQYVYPPLLALLLLPLTILDIGKGGVLWLLALLLAVIGFVWMATHVLGRPLRREAVGPVALLALGAAPLLLGLKYRLDFFLLLLAALPLLGCAAWLAWAARAGHVPSRAALAEAAPVAVPALAAIPTLVGIRFGQVELLLLLLTTLALLAYLRGRDALAGVALGVAAAIKPTLALYGLFALRKRRWATLAAAALTGLALALGPFALLGRGALADWLAVSRYFGAGSYPSYPSNQSARGLLLRLFDGGPRHAPLLDSRLLADLLWVAAALGAVALWWRLVSGTPGRGPRDAIEYALTAALVLFAAPLAEDIHYAALLLPLALLAHAAARGPASARTAALGLAACLYFLQPWLDGLYDRGDARLTRLVASGAYLYGLLLAAAALVLLLRDHGRAARRTRLYVGADNPAGGVKPPDSEDDARTALRRDRAGLPHGLVGH